MLAVSVFARNKPRLDDTKGFTGFFVRKWQKLAKSEKLSDWDDDRTAKFTRNLQKLRSKIIRGTDNCGRIKQKHEDNEIDGSNANQKLKRRRRELENVKQVVTNAKRSDEQKKRIGWSKHQKEAMSSFHEKLQGKRIQSQYARRGGKHSTPQHRLTHILDKFHQMIVFGIEECAKIHDHSNLTSRMTKLTARRAHLHQQGAKFLAKSLGHEWNQEQ